jgi:hypothetical protein
MLDTDTTCQHIIDAVSHSMTHRHRVFAARHSSSACTELRADWDSSSYCQTPVCQTGGSVALLKAAHSLLNRWVTISCHVCTYNMLLVNMIYPTTGQQEAHLAAAPALSLPSMSCELTAVAGTHVFVCFVLRVVVVLVAAAFAAIRTKALSLLCFPAASAATTCVRLRSFADAARALASSTRPAASACLTDFFRVLGTGA